MRHFLLHAVHNIMAFECERRPWNPWVEILAPLAFNYLPGWVPNILSHKLEAALTEQIQCLFSQRRPTRSPPCHWRCPPPLLP